LNKSLVVNIICLQLFKYLLNQLRAWSDPSVKRIFRLPVGSEQSFLEFVHLLKFDQRFIDGETKNVTDTAKMIQPEQSVEHFRTESNPNVRLTDNDRRCGILTANDWQCVFGTLNYSIGVHQIRLKLEKATGNILMGICSQNKPPRASFFYDKPTTHGWFINGYTITNGHGSFSGWPQVNENDILELTINCDRRSLSILNESTQAKSSMQVDINQAPFPWCLLVLFHHKGSRVSLV
jgi:hypothetical protein